MSAFDIIEVLMLGTIATFTGLTWSNLRKIRRRQEGIEYIRLTEERFI